MSFIAYILIALIIMGFFSYSIGKAEVTNGDDLAFAFFIAAIISLLWLPVLALLTIAAPFVVPYKLGIRKQQTEKEKEKMWNKLKN